MKFWRVMLYLSVALILLVTPLGRRIVIFVLPLGRGIDDIIVMALLVVIVILALIKGWLSIPSINFSKIERWFKE